MHGGDDDDDDDGVFPFHINEQTADDTPVIFVVVVVAKANTNMSFCFRFFPFKLVFVLPDSRENLIMNSLFRVLFLLIWFCRSVHAFYWY